MDQLDQPVLTSVQTSTDIIGSGVTQALTRFIHDYQALNPLLSVEFDDQWRSPCEVGEPFLDNQQTRLSRWRPLLRDTDVRHPASAAEFAGLANAIEQPVHPDFIAYFASHWSGHLEATATDGHVSLLQLWNAEDRDRLIENLLGHYLLQKRAKGPVSLFFACTEPDSDLILSLDNQTGAVLLERPGQKPIREVSPNLEGFLATLAPVSVTGV